MDVKLLEDALVLLEEQSLSRAAARRNVTQPAFSRRIRALEDWVGVPLLERRSNRVVLHPTLAGNEAEIRALLARLSRLRERIKGMGQRPETVVFATQHALSANVFPAVFRACAARRPDLGWRLRTLNREDCVSFFMRGDTDLLMLYEARGFPPLPFDASIERRIWMRDTLIPVAGGELRYRIDDTGQPIGRPPLVTYPIESHFGRLIEQTGINTPFLERGAEVRVESAFTVGVLELIRSGAGFGWVPHGMCRAGLASGELVSLARTFGSIPLDITLFAAAANPAASLLMQEI